MSALLILLSLAGALPGNRSQDPLPREFYNRAGATEAMRAAEIARCRLIATAPTGGTGPTTSPVAGSTEEFPRDSASPGLSAASCMVMRGWRIYSLSARDHRALLRLSPKARARAMRALAGAKHPHYGCLISDGSARQLRDPG